MNSISVLEVFMHAQRVGRLALSPKSLCAFEYDAEYLKSGASISPFFLPLEPRLFIADTDPFDGGFGVFNDSLPDGWGSLLLDRYLRERGENPDKLTILQRLSLIGTNGRGAIEYRPDNSVLKEADFADFNKLASDAEKLLASADVDKQSLDSLFKYGGSSGGARPKVFAKIDGKEWLVKFKAGNDPQDVGKTEYEYANLAKECGIQMPEVRLVEGKFFAVERFDRYEAVDRFHGRGKPLTTSAARKVYPPSAKEERREAESAKGKIHTISASGLLNAFYRIPSLDYLDLLKACRALTNDMEQVYALFRQMVFNVVISNRDDHSKNFAFQFKDGRWKLSPAYDLLPSSGFNGFHTTAINNKGEPGIDDIMAVAQATDLNKRRAKEICEQIIDTCSAQGMQKFKL